MASEFHRRGLRWFALIGTIAAAGAVVGSAAIVAQMSGCCGGAPTHACKFIETPKDASTDSSSDAPLPCGFEICQPGVSTCCLEPQSEPPVHCVAIGQVCHGPPGNCLSNSDCPAGSGQVCCGNIMTMNIQCQATCSGDYATDGTLRLCKSDQECPPNLPSCHGISVSGSVLMSIFACQVN